MLTTFVPKLKAIETLRLNANWRSAISFMLIFAMMFFAFTNVASACGCDDEKAAVEKAQKAYDDATKARDDARKAFEKADKARDDAVKAAEEALSEWLRLRQVYQELLEEDPPDAELIEEAKKAVDDALKAVLKAGDAAWEAEQAALEAVEALGDRKKALGTALQELLAALDAYEECLENCGSGTGDCGTGDCGTGDCGTGDCG